MEVAHLGMVNAVNSSPLQHTSGFVSILSNIRWSFIVPNKELLENPIGIAFPQISALRVSTYCPPDFPQSQLLGISSERDVTDQHSEQMISFICFLIYKRYQWFLSNTSGNVGLCSTSLSVLVSTSSYEVVVACWLSKQSPQYRD